jgi:anti-sigma factor RsiW
MKPVDPAEVSAMLDGELSPERAEQVRHAIAEDEELRLMFDELSVVDRDLKAHAVAARFRPRISLSKSASFPAVGVIGFTVAVLILRLAVKVLPLSLSIWLQAAVLVFVIWWMSSHLVRLTQDERWRIVEGEALNTA